MQRALLRGACSAFLVITIAGSFQRAIAKPVRLYVFNLTPDTSYQVRVNSADFTSVYSGPAGAMAVGMDVAIGDVVSVVAGENPDLQPPVPPLFTTLETSDPSCARASWIPSGDPTVVGYVVSYGRNSVAAGDAPQYDQSVSVGAGSFLDVCSLVQGRHYFAIQCRNYAGMLSAYSQERSVDIVVVSVLISTFDASVIDGGVLLSWTVEADEIVLGYRIYRTGPDGVERPLSAGLIEPARRSFADHETGAGTRYTYQLAAVHADGEETRSFALSVETPPLALALGQNVPNPFNPATTIPFVLDAASHVQLRVYDVRGAVIATLVDGMLPEGRHTIAWNGRNSAGRPVSSGTYLYGLVAGKQRLSRKMVLVR